MKDELVKLKNQIDAERRSYKAAIVHAHDEATQDRIMLENEIERLKSLLHRKQMKAAAIRRIRANDRIRICSLKVHIAA